MKKKARIINCSIPAAWYRNKVGAVIDVETCKFNKNFYLTPKGIIKIADVEIINEEK